jgi:membrane protein implicated in regulation of membrane protease activity
MDFFIAHAPWFWLGFTVLFTLIEVFTWGLTTIWFALGALVMVFVSPLALPFAAQGAIFLAVSGVTLAAARPFAIKKLKAGREKTNVDGLVGKEALVTKRVTEFENGEVKLGGQVWSASAEGAVTIEENAKCRVLRIEGVRAVVEPIK